MVTASRTTPFGDLIAAEIESDPDFGAEWLRLTPARAFAAMLVGYRAEHELSQRALAHLLGVSQPRVARLESGERNPTFETIVATVGTLGTEFVVHVGPAQSGSGALSTSEFGGSVVRHGGVAVVASSLPSR